MWIIKILWSLTGNHCQIQVRNTVPQLQSILFISFQKLFLARFSSYFSGVSKYTNLSIPISVLNSNTELLILVIVRWHDYESRQFLRHTIGTQNRFKSYPNLQLLFVFGIPISATSIDLKSIQEENRVNKDMIITGELQILKLLDCFDLSHCTNFDVFLLQKWKILTIQLD